jgi:ABC-type multidrug transport system permease subunit
MLASSIFANFALTIPTVVAILFLARVVFHVHNFGNPLALFLFVSIGTVAFGSLGLVVASITNTMQETQVLNQILWLPLIFLSGATLPLTYLPKMVQGFSVFLPATYLVTGLQQASLLSKSITQLMVYFLVLLGWTLLSFFVASQLFRWEPETKIPRNAKLWAAATIIPFLLLGIWEHSNGKMLAEAQAAYRAINEQHDSPPSTAPKE